MNHVLSRKFNALRLRLIGVRASSDAIRILSAADSHRAARGPVALTDTAWCRTLPGCDGAARYGDVATFGARVTSATDACTRGALCFDSAASNANTSAITALPTTDASTNTC